ncbi:hypothetical protein [Spiroplasma turonicum]|uniref:Uncharacterized protein n=1 Tax=Spiroplasma turonicum TaxID=216946 RepID=A0A0K1P7U8_9MOLU|nr:hypothetical protein [Spiroplasma turonicum]AKU80274.1 hypothetical protein STURON_001028 [Spiroplasma turonicum]ALX71275.1 hypothetical protein STURO_v1c10240 [Spiroplasma turonicum]
MKKIKLDDIAENAWSNALECKCGGQEDTNDIHRLCLICLKPMHYNKHYSVDSSGLEWDIMFYNNENFNDNKFSGITLSVHKKCH